MKQILVIIKKIIFVVFSFIFGIFYNKKRINNGFPKESKDKKEKIKIQKKIKEHKINQEEPTTDRKGRQDLYLKKDLETLYYNLHKIQKIEYQLKIVTDETNLETMKEEIEIIKQALNFLDKKYRKVDESQEEIKNLIAQLHTCKKFIMSTERKLEKISISKKNINNKESLETSIEIKREEKSRNQEESKLKINLKQINEKEKKSSEVNSNHFLSTIEDSEKIGKSNKIPQKESYITPIEDLSNEYLRMTNNILDDILIKDIPDDLVEDKKVNSINDNNQKKDGKKKENSYIGENVSKKKDISISKESASKRENIFISKENQKNKLKIIKQVRSRSMKRTPVNLSLLKQKISILKTNIKLIMISKQKKKPLKFTVTIATVIPLKKQSTQFITQHLMINNYIRKARRVNKRKVKSLKYRKVLELESNMKEQGSYIMTDTLRQIQLLRNEIYSQYELTEEIKKMIEELNEIELEVRMNLEMTSQKEKERSRSR